MGILLKPDAAGCRSCEAGRRGGKSRRRCRGGEELATQPGGEPGKHVLLARPARGPGSAAATRSKGPLARRVTLTLCGGAAAPLSHAPGM